MSQHVDATAIQRAVRAGDGLSEAFIARFNRRQLFQALEGMIQGVVIHRGKALYVNPALVRMIGLGSRDEYLHASSVMDFVHPDDREMVERQAQERIEKGAVQDYEFRLSRVDGSYIWVDCRASRIKWDDQPAALASMSDISARKRSELLFHSVFHSSPDVMTLSTLAEARYIAVNDTFLRVHRMRREEVVGRTAHELNLIADPTLRPRIAKALRAGEEVRDIVTKIRVPEGGIREFSVSAQLLVLDGQQMLLIVARDIAERRRHEAALRLAYDALQRANHQISAANDQLERRVAERTAELGRAHGELLKRERLSALGQLTATVAHELRNPLSAIKNTLFSTKEMAAAKGLDLELPIGRMERSIERCNRIITDLLDFSRMRELQRETVEFDPWLDPVVRDQVLPAGVVLALEPAAEGAMVSLDAERMRRVVINLIDNATQALTGHGAAPGEKRIEIGTRRAGTGLELVVSDNGPGIAPENLARVFEPLFSTKSFGTGLGLPTVKQIIEQHGGSIAIESASGAGTRVRVLLPLLRPSEVQP